jgi:uncharacterized protein (TIGR00304 family)
MRSIVRVLGPVILVVGAALLGEAVATGGARLYLLFVIPVLTGTSPLFGVSVVFLVAGFFLLPFVFLGGELTESSEVRPAPSASGKAGSGSGGMILIGPIPIFFGAWRQNPPIAYRWAVVLGVVLAVAAVLLLWGFSVI